ncbi:hypothetical protein GCM10011450_13690 [Advenella faeciporci]|uniref:Uncharacterized protein n=1 Tax=Advenella faeciporci TaxID=797535 RepID=A0A918MZF1_9BURK|nr:hypothetical protein GCM10011450_13690 [Advenella faeciporci]
MRIRSGASFEAAKCSATTPSGFACHPSAGGEFTFFVETSVLHIPLLRRGGAKRRGGSGPTKPPNEAPNNSPPMEGWRKAPGWFWPNQTA